MLCEFLRISPRIGVLPIIHGSGDFAVEVRRVMLSAQIDCLAVPLPPSFQSDVERAIDFLPAVTAVVQPEPPRFDTEWTGQTSEETESAPAASYVPIDPCQGVIAALRIALGEQIPRAFIDQETARFEPLGAVLPDPYALKRVPSERFAAAILPAVPRPIRPQQAARCRTMATRLRSLESRYRSILLVCSIMDWPWIREAYQESSAPEEDDEVEPTEILSVDPATLVFLLGELPFVTARYEEARANLDDDENLSIDGVKALLLATRDRYQSDLKSRARSVTPKRMSVYFQYVRNLSLVERRMTPDLYSLITGAQQIFGDQFAIHLAEAAREYLATGAESFSLAANGHQSCPPAGRRRRRDEKPPAGSVGCLAEMRAAPASAEARTAQVAHAVESAFAVQLASRGRGHRTLPDARQGHGTGPARATTWPAPRNSARASRMVSISGRRSATGTRASFTFACIRPRGAASIAW